MNQEQIHEIKKQLWAIADRKFKGLGSIQMDRLDFNPFLLKLLSLDTPREIAEFMVGQRIERSVVTSFGLRIQKIAQIISERGTGVEGADICKEKDGVRHYIQLKSGPNTPDKDITLQINKLLTSAMRRNSGSVALLGITYGKKERVSSIIRRYSTVNWIIGKELWEFISGSPDCARELFDLVMDVADNYAPDGGLLYTQRYEEKIQEIETEIIRKYGEGGPEMWDGLFEDNM